MSKNILIVDDEKEIVDLLRLYVEKEGMQVIEAHTGAQALLQMNEHVDLALIDIMLPELSGYEVIRRIRESYNIPIIFISAKGEDHDKILGLQLGADDYITKPFNPMEVVARIQAQLRRYYELKGPNAQEEVEPAIVIGELRLDRSSCVLWKNDVDVPITSTEYKLLSYLMGNAGRVLTKRQIFEGVWDEHYVDDNALMVHISKIRDKIEEDPKKPVYLKTIRGLGYKFERTVRNRV
ncbi:response regulator transcription factor [Paenibacillus xylaniclasticus]|uniref:response regulator transcription factor n=1 Tax=Paenibacillus xylaniclasticus TaxID=588083 RepID=UPI000FDA010F|nr:MULTISPECIES: response regulator transcription factor [Paenibacillus]GFN30816.1 DNA-binding response regulator [Paenibacillus curdlanolyticus]